MDPEESMSDWTIEVVVASNSSKDTKKKKKSSSSSKVYHIHQCILGVGCKKSNLFVKHFRGPFSESKTKSSHMEFERPMAEAFPVVLDYMYSPENKIDFTTKNIRAVMALADYLDIASLRDELAKYCHQHLTFEMSALFFGYGEDYNIPSLLTSSIGTCYMNFLLICPDTSTMSSDSRLTFWIELRKHIKDEDEDWLIHFSRHVAAFCLAHKTELTIDGFKSVTHLEMLPKIHAKAAEQLLQVEWELSNQQNHNATVLSDLQVRCIDTIADAWKAHVCSMDRLVGLNPFVLSNLLIKISEKASTECSRLLETNRIQVDFSSSYSATASSVAAKGIYTLDPNCSYGSHCFVKEGTWNDRSSKFYLYREQANWKIAVVFPGPDPGQHTKNLLYHTCTLAGQASIYNTPWIRFL
jgi:hypothetical protein